MIWNWIWVDLAFLAASAVAQLFFRKKEDNFVLSTFIISCVCSVLLFYICLLRPISVLTEIADIRAEQRKLWTLQMPAETRRILLEPVEARKEKIRRSQEKYGKWSWYFDVELDSLEVDRTCAAK